MRKLIIIPILLLAGLLFFYNLGEVPKGLYSDEAVVGYNAFSVLKTGRDEYGQAFPVLFKFFGTYTPGLFVYLQTIPIQILGLNIVSIRLLSALSMLFLTWLLYKKFGNITALMFAITPWSVFVARLGYETTFGFVLLAIGLLVYKKPILSLVILSLSAYVSFTNRYLAPMLIMLIIAVFYFEKDRFKKMIKPITLALILQIPNMILAFTPAFWTKNSSISTNFIQHYVSYFSPANLFNRQDFDGQRSIPEMAVFYGWMFIPWLIGWWMVLTDLKKPLNKYLLGMLLIMPIPAALANTNYSTQRALPILLPYIVIIGQGMRNILNQLKNNFVRGLFLAATLTFSLIMLVRSYYILLPAQRAGNWDYGYEQLASYISMHNHTSFVVDDAISVPYINLLFFLKYPPAKYQSETGVEHNYYQNIQFSKERAFGNIEVRPIDWTKDECRDVVLVGGPLSISNTQATEHLLSKVIEIKDPRGKVLLQGYKTDPIRCEAKNKLQKK